MLSQPDEEEKVKEYQSGAGEDEKESMKNTKRGEVRTHKAETSDEETGGEGFGVK